MIPVAVYNKTKWGQKSSDSSFLKAGFLYLSRHYMKKSFAAIQLCEKDTISPHKVYMEADNYDRKPGDCGQVLWNVPTKWLLIFMI